MDNSAKWWDMQKAPHEADQQTLLPMSAAENRRRKEQHLHWLILGVLAVAIASVIGILRSCH